MRKKSIVIDDLTILSPQEFAQQVQDQRQRQQALQFLILMPCLDTQVDASEVQLVNAYRAALQLAPHTLKSLQLVSDRKFWQLLLGFTWRMIAHTYPGLGFWQKTKFVFSGIRQYWGDAKIVQLYQALSSLSKATLGRELYDYYRDCHLPLPGEPKSANELIIGHDLVHVLSGIGTDKEGEITVAGFEAGMSRSEFGFELLLKSILDFHLALKPPTIMGILDSGHNHLNPSALMQAYSRGLQMQFDTLDPTWDFRAVFDQPISTLRPLHQQPDQISGQCETCQIPK
ncbi:MAG: hypothetical protein AAGE59_25720 [Cyanobacteria bacterium P01_F01_bin.86]